MKFFKNIFIASALLLFTSSSYSSTIITFDNGVPEFMTLGGNCMMFKEIGGNHIYRDGCESDWTFETADIIFDYPVIIQSFEMNALPWEGYSCYSFPNNFLISAYTEQGNLAYSLNVDLTGYSVWENWLLVNTNNQTPITKLAFGPGSECFPSVDNITINETSENHTHPQTTPIEFTIIHNQAGYEAFGIDCDISLNSDDNCSTQGDLNNQQAVYVASSTIVGSQKVVTIGYASDEPNLSGIGFELNFDSSKLSLFDVSNVFPGAITAGEVYDDGDTLSFSWASVFGQFPGANEVNLATLTFDIVGYEPPTQPQQVISVNNTPKGVLGRTSILEVAYDTTDSNNQLSGLGMRVHFDSSLLSFKEITGLIEQDIIVDGQGPFSDDADFDNDPLTDQYMLFGWASLYNNWPNTELPSVLMNIAFDVSENINTDVISSTNINFTDTSFTVGYEFSAESYELEILNATWDFDGNGQADALTDGLMMLRHLFGLRGDLVTNDAMAGNSPFDSQQVVAEIEAAMDIADIDADGELNALTDGLLLLRYLFDLRDDSLTNGAVGPDATRSSDADIQNYLESHMPNSLPIVPGAPADFTEAFGGTIISEDATNFEFPASAEAWGGFAHINTDLFPLAFSEAGSITFNASIPSGGSANIRFVLEYQPYPDIDPAYYADAITVSGSDTASYTVVIPSQGANTFSSMIMYIDDRDVAVTITDVKVNSD